jgi:hypothetical protein
MRTPGRRIMKKTPTQHPDGTPVSDQDDYRLAFESPRR